MNNSMGELRYASWSRFYRSYCHLVNHKTELKNSKYQKYIRSCSEMDNDVIKMIIDGKRLGIGMWICNRYYAVLRRLMKNKTRRKSSFS